MAITRFTLTGWKAALALAAVLAFLGFRYYNRAVTLESDGREVLRLWLAAEYSRDALAPAQQGQALDPVEQQAMAEELLRRQNVKLHDIRARGRGDTVIVRTGVSVDGGDPPDGQAMRYFMMGHSMLTGWRLLRETTALRYYLYW